MAHESILIIDSDVALAEVLKSRLEAVGYRVNCARTGKDALATLKSEWVDLIVQDIVLKGDLNGFQLLKKIKQQKNFSQIPVIILSGKVSMKKTTELMGVETFFIKPCATDVLMEEIKDILNKKILIFGDKNPVTGKAAKMLEDADHSLDILLRTNKLYFNIVSYRYDLIVLEYRLRPNVTDRILTIIRGSRKNKETPVIIYMSAGEKNVSERELQKIYLLRKRLESVGACEFLGRGYSQKQFTDLFVKYIDFE